MSKSEFEQFIESFYTAYVNLKRKHGQEPIKFWQFRKRMEIWEW